MRIPDHVGIIPDGNRRWAKANGLNRENGYQFGLEPGLEVLKLAKSYGIKELTFYGFTMDNCKRPAVQKAAFQNACVDAVNIMISEGCSLLVMGNTQSPCFPKTLLPYTKRTDTNGETIKVNLLVNYGWEWDLSAINKGAPEHDILKQLHSKDISRIDLIIRWGNMRRLSGFLPVQSVYSDFFVVDKMWPEFCSEDFTQALAWYNKQDVTLGG